jgi:hypothetical protein
MGVFIAFGECFCCRRPFGFNPNLVPSYNHKGTKHPICKDCIDEANPKRIENGLEPIVPLEGAYEPADESEL